MTELAVDGATERLDDLVEAVLLQLPGLSRPDARTALVCAQVTGPRVALALTRHLDANPTALTAVASEPPLSVIRLAYALHDAGAAVALPTCADCGRRTVRLSRRNAARRRVCGPCYRPPARACSRCGRTGPIQARANADHPDLCSGCYQGPRLSCSICDRERPCPRFASGLPVCGSCLGQQRPPRACALCKQKRAVQAEWPLGPVCRGCYGRTRNDPRPCPRCEHARPLIALDDAGIRICGPCAGTALDYACRTCGHSGDLFADRQCCRCVLALRVTDLLTGPNGEVPERMAPLRSALSRVDRPRSMLYWLRTSSGASLLARLAAAEDPLLTHQLLDQLAGDSAPHYVRSVLVHAGVLPEREEYLERLTPWLERTLAGQPRDHVRLMRPFAQWVILRRARHRAQSRQFTRAAAQIARTRVLIALEFLRWLDSNHLSLAQLTQDRLDAWLSSGSSRRYQLRVFLTWTGKRGLSAELEVPAMVRGTPEAWLDDDDHWRQLQACLTDTTMPLDVRAAGGLLLLFGVSPSRLARLTMDNISHRATKTYLHLGEHALLIPPAMARVIADHRAQSRTRSLVQRGQPHGPSWLFPGDHPGRHLGADSISRKLRQAGIEPRAGRNTGLVTLAADLPPAVLADLLGLHLNTAVRWAAYARRDWQDYLTARTASEDS